MKVKVGSTNLTKLRAVEEAFRESASFASSRVSPVEVTIEEFGHPVGIEAIVRGAVERARQSFVDCDLSIGIEGGLIEIPGTKSGYMEVAVCAIHDGERFHLGMSPGYEWPKRVTELILHGGLDGSQALKQAGLTSHEKIGTAQGGIGILTRGRMDRTAYNRQAVTMALVHLENPERY